jgi:hypothetical protein
MRPGNIKEGWWGYDDFERQVGDANDAFNVCYRNAGGYIPTPDLETGEPDALRQVLLLTDWSQGHCAKPENGLCVHSLSMGFGGKHRSRRARP